MKTKNLFKAKGMILPLFLTLLVFIACNKKEILESQRPEIPALTDPIPYDVLGRGTIVFERIGPYPGEWESWYVINVEQKKTWSLQFKRSTWLDFISPDGKKIAFSAHAIYTMNIDGSEMQKITEGEFGYMSSWSPDSKKLYFRQDFPPRLYSQSAIPNATDLKQIKIFTIQTYPGSPEWIIAPSGAVTISSEGKIAYACNLNRQNGLAGLYIMENDGSNLSLIVPLPEGKIFDSPVFSPDGQSIYFFSVEKDSSGAYVTADLMRVNPDGSNLQMIKSLAVGGQRQWHYSVSKSTTIFLACSLDGSKLLFNLPKSDFVSHLYVLNIDGTGFTQVTFAEGVTDRCASWGR